MNAAAAKAVRLVDAAIRKATRRFKADYAPELPKVLGSSQRIEQVVINLVLNACQALPDQDRAVEISTRADGDGVLVTVRDEGTGIAPDHMPRLTDPFFTTKRESGGTGLGLSVSAGIVKELGGTLEFSSVQGQGTVVTLRLPAAREDHRQ